MAKVTFRTDLCKGCGLCVNACPKGILAIAEDKINNKGYSPAVMTDQDKCIGCKKCLTTGCPALSFDKYERKVSIDPLQCVGCTVCAQVCPKQAIVKGAKKV